MGTPENPPAFPCETDRSWETGMSLRDWFAGQALAGWLASFGPEHEHPAFMDDAELMLANTAGAAYRCADAMLAEREKGGAQ